MSRPDLAAKGQQILECYAELMFRITTQVLLDESRSETIEAIGHGRVSGEEVPRSGGGECDFEGLRGLLHETAGAFQYGKGRMPFIEMTDLRLDAKRTQQSPSADPEKQFLLEAQLRTSPI